LQIYTYFNTNNRNRDKKTEKLPFVRFLFCRLMLTRMSILHNSRWKMPAIPFRSGFFHKIVCQFLAKKLHLQSKWCALAAPVLCDKEARAQLLYDGKPK
jgi:hypothetical protein